MNDDRRTEFFWAPPAGEEIKGIIQFRDVIVVACSHGIYVMGDVLAVSKICSESAIQKLNLHERR